MSFARVWTADDALDHIVDNFVFDFDVDLVLGLLRLMDLILRRHWSIDNVDVIMICDILIVNYVSVMLLDLKTSSMAMIHRITAHRLPSFLCVSIFLLKPLSWNLRFEENIIWLISLTILRQMMNLSLEMLRWVHWNLSMKSELRIRRVCRELKIRKGIIRFFWKCTQLYILVWI